MKPRTGSIKRQVLTFALFTCIGVLLPVGGVLFLHHYNQTLRRLSDSLQATSLITAANVSAALAFNDKDAAVEILSALRNDPLITSATLFDLQNKPFAGFGQPPTVSRSPHETDITVVFGGATYGHLRVTGDIARELHHTAVTWFSAYAIAFAAACSASLLIARRFQRIVSAPIVELAATATRVTFERDYTTRASLDGCNEVHDLAKALNAMLTEIGRRDARLAYQVEALNHEIAERKTAEHALRENQSAMVHLSREAGIAEVAAGVLHNIGNVLTSINVSSDLLTARLTGSLRRPLHTLKTVLDDTGNQSAAVFAAHPDGPALRDLLRSVTHTVASDIDEGARLLVIMHQGIAHLKRIVTSQQSLARTTRLSEFLVMRDALQDAVMLSRSISRQNSPISDCPINLGKVHADRSMVVQILLNLLINAQDSVTAQAPNAPLISLAIEPGEPGFLNVTVTDNGVGIAPDKLISIFTYGYTTKPHGHGFGLHNSANAARLMGGSLTVTSPGPGLGATFTLSLPTQPTTAATS